MFSAHHLFCSLCVCVCLGLGSGASPWTPRTARSTPTSTSSSSRRFAKRKLDESVFMGNRLQVSYAPQFESLLDTKEKLEVRRNEVLTRIRSPAGSRPEGLSQYSLGQGSSSGNPHHHMNSNKREYAKTMHATHIEDARFSHVPSNKDYFPSESMNATVNLVRQKLDKIQSGGDTSDAAAAASKKPRVDNRRRI
ncbi:uncharacterized protein [Triticum aestivum]|uniref:uncharacterized protein isoform X2 n=1 Tax=Triticum aestivum TaxID=4565 RepID=UPI00098BC4CF|nr:uncharacterized protein LOC123143023 isoform X2 [Triticum aestivum]